MPRNREPAIPVYEPRDETAVVHKAHPHDSARLHVRGAAAYIDDIREPQGTLHIAVGMADKACGALRGLDLSAVRAAHGVAAVLTAADIPGKNDIAPVFEDEPLFADKDILFHGQALFAVVARTRDAARRAARLARIEIAESPPAITIEDALATGARVLPDYEFRRGDVDGALAAAPHRLEGTLPHRRPGALLSRGTGFARHSRRSGRNDGALLDAGPDRGPAHRRARARPAGRVRHRRDAAHGRRFRRQGEPSLRLGGDRGARRARRPARRARSVSTATTISSSPASATIFAPTGGSATTTPDVSSAYDVMLNARCGCSVDLSLGVVDRAMFHASNAYWLPDVRIGSRRLKTNTVSNTAFRGFGGPQGMIAIERVMDAIARERGLDPLDVRKANFYRLGADRTPYGQQVEDSRRCRRWSRSWRPRATTARAGALIASSTRRARSSSAVSR